MYSFAFPYYSQNQNFNEISVSLHFPEVKQMQKSYSSSLMWVSSKLLLEVLEGLLASSPTKKAPDPVMTGVTLPCNDRSHPSL